MPYKSDAQRRFMHARHPEIAARWDAEIRAKKKKGKISKSRFGTFMEHPATLGIGTGVVAGGITNQIPKYQPKKRKKGQLQPIGPTMDKIKRQVYKADTTDPFFNHQAAQKTFDLIMKMDDDTAEVFCFILASELLETEIEKNYTTLQRHLNEVIAKRLADTKAAVLKAASNGGPEAVAYAQALALLDTEIRKDDQTNWEFERKIRRDPTTGRFQVKFSRTTNTKPVDDKSAKAFGIAGTTHADYKRLSNADKADYQHQYLQVANFLQSAIAASGSDQIGDAKILLHYRDENTGDTWTEQHMSDKPNQARLRTPGVRVVAAEAQPSTLTTGGAAFSLAGAMGRQLSPTTVGNLNLATPAAAKTFADSWTTAGNETPELSNARLYARTAKLGGLAAQYAPAGSKLQLAGKMADIVGQYGPEAEKVIGPTARKTAYRYRGTERAPDARLVREYGKAIEEGKRQGPRDKWAEKEELAIRERRAERPPRWSDTRTRGTGSRVQLGTGPAVARSLTQMVAERQDRANRAPDWQERELGRDAVADYLTDRLPSKKLYRLQLASGNTPPSEGVIINADGQIVSQAVGYGDDHYLPFNLKNLKGLKGGEYIRNRSVGGLTSEDIYTGLMSGARRVTVVSRSGIFTMEFQPDFRGGRRHNDKAMRMTRRYEQILDAVQSEQVERAEVPDRWKKLIAQEVKEQYPSNASPLLIRTTINARIKDLKENPEIDGRDLDRAEAAIERMQQQADAGIISNRDVAQYKADIMGELKDMKEVRFRLNGVGYAAALDSLAEQFPYYIHADHRIEDEGLLPFDRDKGYVEPGRNRPTAALAGWYGTVANKTGKRSAATVNYQRGLPGAPEVSGEARERSGGGGEESEGPSGGGTATLSQDEQRRERMLEAAETGRRRTQMRTAAANLQQQVMNQQLPEGTPEPAWWRLTPNEFRVHIQNDDNLRDFDTFVQANAPKIRTIGASALTAYQNKKAELNPVAYTDELSRTFPASPYTMADEGRAYRLTAKPEEIEHEIMQLDGKDQSLTHNIPLSQMNDAQMAEEVDTISTIMDGMAAEPDLSPADYEQNFLQFLDPKAPEGYARRIFTPGGAQNHLKRIHQMHWLLKHRQGGRAGGQIGGRGPEPEAPPSRPAPPAPSGGTPAPRGFPGGIPGPGRLEPLPPPPPKNGHLEQLSAEDWAILEGRTRESDARRAERSDTLMTKRHIEDLIKAAQTAEGNARDDGDYRRGDAFANLQGELDSVPRDPESLRNFMAGLQQENSAIHAELEHEYKNRKGARA